MKLCVKNGRARIARAKMMPQVFLVPQGKRFDLKKIPGKKVAKSGWIKPIPRGSFLWTSSLKGRGSAWTEFAKEKDQDLLATGGDRIVFSVKPGAKVLHVTNRAEFSWALEAFSYQKGWMKEDGLIYLDWEAISKKYDGFHFGGGSWPGNYTSHPEWDTLEGWDVESTVWFNPKVLDFQGVLPKRKAK